jgi:hypothetical protein
MTQKRLHVQKGITMHPDVQRALTELAKEMCTSESGCISQLVLAEAARLILVSSEARQKLGKLGPPEAGG